VRKYLPREIEPFIGFSQDLVRDWRRRPELHVPMCQVGEQTETGRWQYRVDDLVALAVARILTSHGYDLGLSIHLGVSAAPVVIAWVTGEPQLAALRETPFIVGSSEIEEDPSRLYFIARRRSLSRLVLKETLAFFVVDCRVVARRLPEPLILLLTSRSADVQADCAS
jgi:hypothetical protein